MEKIPTIFERDWEGSRAHVLDVVNPVCEWVFDGDGLATRKYDGTCIAVIGTMFYKRYERKIDRRTNEIKPEPEGFKAVAVDPITGEIVGWVPADASDPANRWLFEAYNNREDHRTWFVEGTYELVGPKINGNPDGFEQHELIKHSDAYVYLGVERTFEGLKAFFGENDIEGLVFHHSDGRMAKIKGRDLGVKRGAPVASGDALR